MSDPTDSDGEVAHRGGDSTGTEPVDQGDDPSPPSAGEALSFDKIIQTPRMNKIGFKPISPAVLEGFRRINKQIADSISSKWVPHTRSSISLISEELVRRGAAMDAIQGTMKASLPPLDTRAAGEVEADEPGDEPQADAEIYVNPLPAQQLKVSQQQAELLGEMLRQNTAIVGILVREVQERKHGQLLLLFGFVVTLLASIDGVLDKFPVLMLVVGAIELYLIALYAPGFAAKLRDRMNKPRNTT